MPAALIYGLCGAALVGLGLYGFVTHRHLLRRILAFNVAGSGVFLYFGAAGARDPGADPVPQALIITGIVVAFSATGLAVALAVAYARATGRSALAEDDPS
ncbi:NADH-quinone oxidoreductase subunit K [soil metagenome]